jgi:hypothetical protein
MWKLNVCLPQVFGIPPNIEGGILKRINEQGAKDQRRISEGAPF